MKAQDVSGKANPAGSEDDGRSGTLSYVMWQGTSGLLRFAFLASREWPL